MWVFLLLLLLLLLLLFCSFIVVLVVVVVGFKSDCKRLFSNSFVSFFCDCSFVSFYVYFLICSGEGNPVC